MIPFLKLVADDLYRRCNGKLENVAVVFPNKRAALFFNQYLLENSGNVPIWSPRYMTISDLFRQHSNLAVADKLLLVCKLYKEYIAPVLQAGNEKAVESLDEFYYWGDMLVNDFDDIDKNLADAGQLFANIKDLRELGTAKDTLSQEQKEAINRFFINFNPEEKSDIKNNFLNVWERLHGIYTGFKEALRREKIAYEGMLYRDVVENLENISFDYEKYVFVGFNVLNGVETKLFSTLEKSGKALFYWDYDKHYVNDRFNEAGHFMRRNLERFPNALHQSHFSNLAGKKSVSVVSASGNSIQARYLSQWLGGNLTEKEIETAVVLCDETMLEPVLHTIPEEANGNKVQYMNVTMGYPIANTPIFTLVKLLIELQVRGWNEKQGGYTLANVCSLLKHPYIIQCSAASLQLCDELLESKKFYPTPEELSRDQFLASLFTRIDDNKEWMENISSIIYDVSKSRTGVGDGVHELFDKLFIEAIYKAYTQAQRMVKLLDSGELDMKQATIGRLFVKMLSKVSLPFHGEPVMGLQVMGLLETRNLDFRNVIMLSVNEGNIPRNSSDSSYIPYNLRRAFGLTLSEQRDAIYAYNFYRLLQRAEKVTLVYNNSSSGKIKGECSRYILQLLGSNLYDIERLDLSAEQCGDRIETYNVKRSPEMVDILRRRFDTKVSERASRLTPTAVNRYIGCKLSFFYYYVLGLKPLDEVDTEMNAADFGLIFHKSAELFYEEITEKNGSVVTGEVLEYYIKAPALLYRFVNKAFEEIFFKGGKAVYNGEQYINRGIIHRFLLRLIKMDRKFVPFRYICSEKVFSIPYSVMSDGREISLEIGGTIDRIDVKGDTINIVDYKTGNKAEEKNVTLDVIFNGGVKSAANRLQSLLYSVALEKRLSGEVAGSNGKEGEWVKKLEGLGSCRISPSLLYLSKGDNCAREEFVVDVDGVPVNDISSLKGDYVAALDSVIAEMFDTSTPFTATEDKERCKYCNYKQICGR